MPKVSVIVPVYGVEKYIERCARSLFEQTLDDIEFIFVDDCTPDSSIEILNAVIKEYRLRFAEMNYTVRFERMPTNSGLPAVRRHGIQLATGDYIIHCDSDDWVDTDMYRMMYEKAIGENSDVVVCDFSSSTGNKILKTYSYSTTNKKEFIQSLLDFKGSWSLVNKLCKSELYSGIIPPMGAMGEDMVITIQLLMRCAKISHIQKSLYYYYCNPDSITQTPKVEKIWSRCNEAVANTNLLINLYKSSVDYNRLKLDFTPVKMHHLELFYPILVSKNDYKKWNNLFPGVSREILFSAKIDCRRKVKYFVYSLKGKFSFSGKATK